MTHEGFLRMQIYKPSIPGRLEVGGDTPVKILRVEQQIEGSDPNPI